MPQETNLSHPLVTELQVLEPQAAEAVNGVQAVGHPTVETEISVTSVLVLYIVAPPPAPERWRLT